MATMRREIVTAENSEQGVDAPLLSLGQKNFTTTSTGSMEVVGLRERKITKVSEFEAHYRQPEDKATVVETVKEVLSKKCSKCSLKKVVTSNLPILRVLRKYKILQDLPSDVVSGLTAGIMMIPQGLAFASLSTLQPIIGLYISLFSSITYFFLGTGQQLSFGCIAILSIMMGAILDKYETRLRESTGSLTCDTQLVSTIPTTLLNETSLPFLSTTTELTSVNGSVTLPFDDTLDPMVLEAKKLEVAGSVSLLCGIIFVVLGKVGFGKVTVFMSDSLVTGITVGAAFHVGSSQLKTMFGLSFLPRKNGVFKLLKLWYSILSNIHHSNIASIIASAICILLIYLVKRFVNEKYKKKLRVPIPIELIVMILATFVSYYGDLNEKFDISIIKKVPVGVPKPRFPDLSLGVDYLADGMMIIIVAFAQTVSIAKLMGLKHGYKVDPDQEMFAVGMVNIVCAVFSGYISGASVSRTVVQDSAGGRSQIASLFAAILVLLVMLFIGPYFYHVPKISLSAIIIVSLRSLFLKLLTIPDMWRKSKVDCITFVTTVVAVVVLDADIGLLVGVLVSIFLVLFQSMMSSTDVTACITVGDLGIWRSSDKYYGGEEFPNLKVVRINNPLFFVNAEITANAVFTKTGLNPLKIKKEKRLEVDVEPAGESHKRVVEEGMKVEVKIKSSSHQQQNGQGIPETNVAIEHEKKNVQSSVESSSTPFTVLVLDMSGVSFIDLMGVKSLEFIIEKYKNVGISVYVVNVTEKCLDTLKKTGFMGKQGDTVLLSTGAILDLMSQSQNPNLEVTRF